jgi:hypothetical protein
MNKSKNKSRPQVSKLPALLLPGALALIGCNSLPQPVDEQQSNRLGAVGSKVETSTAEAPLVVPPGPVTLFGVSSIGTGCPTGSVSTAITPDGSALDLTYSAFVASVEGSAKSFDAKNCTTNFGIHVPQGFRYAMTTVDYGGYFALTANVVGRIHGQYVFVGHPDTAGAAGLYVGAADGSDADGSRSWQGHSTLQFAPVLWSPCGTDVLTKIDQTITLSDLAALRGASPAPGYSALPPDPQAFGEIGTADTLTNLQTHYTLQWERCS